MSDQPCECPGPGFCERYQRLVEPVQHAACRGGDGMDPAYRDQVVEWLATHPNPASRPRGSSVGVLVSAAGHFASAVVHHAADGFNKLDAAEKAARVATCHACPSRDVDRDICSECRCPINKKASWRSEACPLGKW